MSVIKHNSQRVAVLIDTQNLYHSARNLYNTRVNFSGVLEQAVAGRQLVRAIAYVITTEAQDESQFFEALTKMGIETRTKDLQIFFGGAKKADWDVGIAVDAIRLASKIDTIVIATGDGDFAPLVEYVKQLGVQVEVMAFGQSSSSKLREVCEDFIDLSNDPKKFLINYRPAGYQGSKAKRPAQAAPKPKKRISRSGPVGSAQGSTSTDQDTIIGENAI